MNFAVETVHVGVALAVMFGIDLGCLNGLREIKNHSVKVIPFDHR
jgi:hypothetical protein